MTRQIEPGTALADAVRDAAQALRRSDTAAVDAAYLLATGLAPADLSVALAIDHVSCLVRLREFSLARRRCTDHIARHPSDHLLLLARAETHLAFADVTDAETDADAAESICGEPKAADLARLSRIRGLIAADREHHDAAIGHLAVARERFVAAGDRAGVAMVDRDRRMVLVRRGVPTAVAATLDTEPQSVADRLVYVWALKRQQRYEEALTALPDVEGLDDALRARVRKEKAVLGFLVRQDDAVGDLVEDTLEADFGGSPFSPRFSERLRYARGLIVHCENPQRTPTWQATVLHQAESIVVDLRGSAAAPGEVATWRLAAGELELARNGQLTRAGASDAALREVADEASGHFRCAVRAAGPAALAEVRSIALRGLGRARLRAQDQGGAIRYWQAAHRIEEEIANRQLTDDVKTRMLLAATDEHDELVNAAVRAVDHHGPQWIAPVVVAMESAHGRMIIDALGDVTARESALPPVGDLAGACAWLRDQTRDLPRSTMIWMTHVAPQQVHHALLGRDRLLHLATTTRPGARGRLHRAVRALASYCEPNSLERSIASGDFDNRLTTLSALLELDKVIAAIPPHVTRLVVVAGEPLSRVPMAALPIPGTGERLVARFALSDLPCVSVRRSLARRARRGRGNRSLLVRPIGTELAEPADLPGRTVLAEPTVQGLRDALARRRGHHVLRIDGHGEFGADPWLQLDPAGDAGRLRPAQLRDLDLSGCGTVTLAACESGMAEVVGRGERIGFVRAALHAGAASVLSARWIAEDPVTADLLDCFERYLRHLPRDVALRRAQLDVCAGRTPRTRGMDAHEHPARWACWTVYGDPGLQTGAGALWRGLRKTIDDWRPRANRI